MIEKEFKALLDEGRYESLVNVLANLGISVSSELLLNYYYDTPSFDLFMNGETLRIRQIDSNLRLEYKRKVKIAPGIRHSEEIYREVEAVSATISPQSVSPSSSWDICGILGSSTTLRIAGILHECLIALDKTHYFGKVDYELEVEYESEAKLEMVLSELGEKSRTTHPGKYSRFVAEHKRIWGKA